MPHALDNCHWEVEDIMGELKFHLNKTYIRFFLTEISINVATSHFTYFSIHLSSSNEEETSHNPAPECLLPFLVQDLTIQV